MSVSKGATLDVSGLERRLARVHADVVSMRKYDDVAQRQHRIGSGFTWRKRWAWLCSGHGPKSIVAVPLRRDPPVRSHDRVPMGRKRNKGKWAAAAISAPKGQSMVPFP